MSQCETMPPAPPSTPPQALVLMGVSGSGKTTVGRAAAARLGWAFHDADAFHPPENVAKMGAGVPLTDADRAPWLARLHDLIGEHVRGGASLVLACSALKASYRETLRGEHGRAVRFAYLQGDFATIATRLQARQGHYMKAGLLESQFAALEPPQDALPLDIAEPPEALVARLVAYCRE